MLNSYSLSKIDRLRSFAPAQRIENATFPTRARGKIRRSKYLIPVVATLSVVLLPTWMPRAEAQEMPRSGASELRLNQPPDHRSRATAEKTPGLSGGLVPDEAGGMEGDLETTFEALLLEAFEEHPAWRERQAEASVLRARRGLVGVRPDPRASLSAEMLEWNDPDLQNPMGGIQLSLVMPLWWPGELKLEREVLEQQAQAVALSSDSPLFRLATEAADQFATIYRLDQTAEALRATLLPLETFLELTRARIPVGQATVAQAQELELERMHIEERLLEVTYQRPQAVQALNALLNRKPSAPVRPPNDLGRSRPRAASVDLNLLLQQSLEQTMARRPEVAQWRQQIAVAEKRAALAEYEKYPDLSVFGGWRFRRADSGGANAVMGNDGTDFFTLGIQSTLPIWSRSKAQAASDVAQAEAVRLETQIEAFELEMRQRLSERIWALERIHRQIEYYRNRLIPQTQRVLEAALSGFSTGQATYDTWLRVQQRLLTQEVELAELEGQALKEAMALRALTGNWSALRSASSMRDRDTDTEMTKTNRHDAADAGRQEVTQ